MITLQSYWKGRNHDPRYAAACTAAIQANASETVRVMNLLLEMFKADTGVDLQEVSSGWRPPAINEATSNAGAKSTHLLALATDMRDTADRLFARWCLGNRQKLAVLGLYIEDPRWTAKFNEVTKLWSYWVHVQRVPPKSGKRIYVPSLAPPVTAALSKWTKPV